MHMQAGFAEAVVTPPLGIGMAGYFEERLADGVRDHLYSRAVVASDNGQVAALVVTDLICVLPADVTAVRQHVADMAPIPPANVMVAATHTHTGPVVHPRPGFRRDETYMAFWARATAGAVVAAYRNQQSVTVGCATGVLPGLAFNRRFRMKSGRVHTNPGVGNPDIVAPAGPVDPQVTVLRFDGTDHRPLGIVAHFTCHTDTMGGSQISADWVGVAARALRDMLAPLVSDSKQPLGVVILNGACADINHIDAMRNAANRPIARATDRIGLSLAAEATKVALRMDTASPPGMAGQGVAATSRKIRLSRIPVGEFLEQSQAALADPHVGRMERRRAEANLDFADFYAQDSADVNAEVACLRIGPCVIASAPGEYPCELGLAFKTAVPSVHGIVANLANGFLGYVPPLRAYTEGGYETRSSRMQPGSAEQIWDAALEMAREVTRGG